MKTKFLIIIPIAAVIIASIALIGEELPETEIQFFLEYTKEGGIAGIRESIRIDSDENRMTLQHNNEEFGIPISEQEISGLIKLVNDSDFFTIEEKNYPPQEGWADYFTYSLKIVSGNLENKLTWSDASEITPDVTQKILKQIELIKSQNFRG